MIYKKQYSKGANRKMSKKHYLTTKRRNINLYIRFIHTFSYFGKKSVEHSIRFERLLDNYGSTKFRSMYKNIIIGGIIILR